jgi:hypothetical protein
MSYLELLKRQLGRLGYVGLCMYGIIIVRHAWDGYTFQLDWLYLSGYTLVFVFGGAFIYWLFPSLRYRDYFMHFDG